MPRLLRFAAPGIPQHVIQRGNNRSAMFVSAADYELFRECLERACARHGCRVHAYVLMTNHVHLLVTPSGPAAVAKVMQSVGRRYVPRFNLRHHRTGTLWEGRYRATVIESERYLFACYRYIELNPVRAGIARTPRDYRWSSHLATAFGIDDPLVTPHERYRDLGPDAGVRRAAYRALFSNELPDSTLDEIRAATQRGEALGGERFRAEMASRLSGPMRSKRRRGRPRREEPQLVGV